MPKIRLSGGTMVFMGAFCWSLCSPIVKFLTLDSFLILGLRSVIAAVALAAFVRPKQLKWNGWMLMYVCSYAALTMSVILALSMTSAPIVIGMQYTSLVWLFLVNLLRTKKLDKRAFAPVCVILVGVTLFMLSGTGGSNTVGNLIALSEGVSFACMTVSSKRAAGSNPIGLTAVANLFTFLLVLLVFPAKMAGVAEMGVLEWVLMLIQGVVQVGGGYALYNMGLQRVSPQKASIIALWEMLLGPLWVAIFLREYPAVPVLIGFVIIMAGIFLDAKLNAAPGHSHDAVGTAQN